jgi:histone H3/H4
LSGFAQETLYLRTFCTFLTLYSFIITAQSTSGFVTGGNLNFTHFAKTPLHQSSRKEIGSGPSQRLLFFLYLVCRSHQVFYDTKVQFTGIMYQVPPQNRPIRVDDSKRVQRILDELNAKYTDRKTGTSQQVALDDKAQQMFIDYANELTIAVLEASSLLAQHRGSKTIDVEDVNMILSKILCFTAVTRRIMCQRFHAGKKLGIELPGYGQTKQAVIPESMQDEAAPPTKIN